MNAPPRKSRNRSRLQAAALVLVVWGAMAASPATADALSNFMSAYKQIEYYAPPGSLPVKSSDLVASKALFNCLAGADVGNKQGDPGVCMAQFHNTPLGKQASDAGGIPETFWRVVDAYIAYLENDYWGVAHHLGEAAVCAVVQVLLGGVDACSLIKELVELAEDLYDSAKAVGEFLEDVGGAALDAGSCLVTLGSDCGDDSPPAPDEVFVYEYIFLPRITEGVAKRELADGSFDTFLGGLQSNAGHKPYPILSKPWPLGEASAKAVLYPHFTSAATAHASTLFAKAVDTDWSKHVLTQILPQLGTERTQYLLQQVPAVAKQAAQAYLNQQYVSPAAAVTSLCYTHFTKTRPYRHVDDWIALHAVEAEKFKLVDNTKWCETVFWGQKPAFAQHFHDYIVSNSLCPELSAALVCQSLDGYKACTGLLGSVSQQNQCGMNAQYVGGDIAQEIVKYFKSRGSKYADSCEIPKALSTLQSKSPAVLRCHRPTLRYHCDKYYQQHYGAGVGKVPFKALTCELGAKLPNDYQAKEDKTWGSMVPALAAKHPAIEPYVKAKGPDPLWIVVPPKIYGELETDAKDLGFQFRASIDTEPPIDGMEEPTFVSSLEGVLKDSRNTQPTGGFSTLKTGGVNPPDPTGELSTRISADTAMAPSAMTPAGLERGATGQSTMMSGNLPGGRPEDALPTDAVSATGAVDASAPPPGGLRTEPGEETSAPAPTACEFDLSYLAPQPPVLESSSPGLAAGDQVRISCRYAIATRRMTLPACDEQARRTADTLRAPGIATDHVLSAIVAVDGQPIGVGSVPAGSQSYEKTAIWSFNETGSHTISCQADNPLAAHVRGADLYLAEAIEAQVGTSEPAATPRAFDPAQARSVPTRALAPPTAMLPGGPISVSDEVDSAIRVSPRQTRSTE